MYVTEEADHAAFTAPHSPSMNAKAWRRLPAVSVRRNTAVSARKLITMLSIGRYEGLPEGRIPVL
jgi:hypothetical protein